jgi:hypothetical protein
MPLLSSTRNGLHMLKALFAFFAFTVLSACATHPKVLATKPVIKSIAIIPATEPAWFSFENVSAMVYVVPISFWGNKLDSRHKAKLFNEKLRSEPTSLAADFTNAVAQSLRAQGFDVEIMADVKRISGDPDNVDYDKLTTRSDAILHLWLSEAGLYSSRTSLDYIPRVNGSGKLFVKGQDDNVWNNDLYYGVDAKKGKEWAILPDPKFVYPSFDAVMANMGDVRLALDTAAVEIGKKMSEQIGTAVK